MAGAGGAARAVVAALAAEALGPGNVMGVSLPSRYSSDHSKSDAAVLADRLGFDHAWQVEHHFMDEYSHSSSPETFLAAAAARTSRIRLTSAVTVLSSDDPVRVFQDFATIDLLSGGRAEIMAGRGSFIESFPLFGYDLADYDELFAELLETDRRLRSLRSDAAAPGRTGR